MEKTTDAVDAYVMHHKLMPAMGPEPRSHPMIEALVAQLDRETPSFPLDRRLVWLRMAAMAFDLAYGVEAPIYVDPEPREFPVQAITQKSGDPHTGRATVIETIKDVARLPKPRASDQMFVIDLDNRAWGRNGPLTYKILGPSDIVWDFRPVEQGLENVIWSEPVIDRLPPFQVFKA